jgi:hypothetical protein
MTHRDSAWCSANLLRNSACAEKCLSRRAGLTFKKAQSLVVLRNACPLQNNTAGNIPKQLDTQAGRSTLCVKVALAANVSKLQKIPSAIAQKTETLVFAARS